MSRRGPLTAEEREFAAKHGRGAGAAAVLLFLHVVLVGYLLCALWYLVPALMGEGMVVSLHWWWQVFFPAWLAVLTYLPTNPLTRGVGRVAVAAGGAVLLVGCGAWLNGRFLEGSGRSGEKMAWLPVILAASATVAALVRWCFRALMKGTAPDFDAKGDDELANPE